MIQASFDAQRSRETAIGGAYQYDTGQRIRMYGLPSPEELNQMDDFLSGDTVAVQAQFGYKGDSQSEPRLALYDDVNGCWTCEVPDAYLTRSESVFVYVYVMYGADAEHSRSKTMYTGCFTPISRPAPNTTVTPDQLNAWDALVAEVNMTLSRMNEAISDANAAVTGIGEAVGRASNAAQDAEQAADRANDQAAMWEKATASAKTLDAGSAATVTMTTNAQGGRHLEYGIPRGEKGDKGDKGPAGVTFRLEGATLYIDTY